MTADRSAVFSRRVRRLLVAGGLAGAAAVVPAAVILTGGSADTAPRSLAQECTNIVIPNGGVVPACGPEFRGGSVSAGAPSQELITLKNLCNLYIGGCSAAFYYPPGPVARPDVKVGNNR